MEFNFKNICDNFKIEGEFISAEPYGEGHINNTFLVKTDKTKYILQRVNNTVFKNPIEVMDNISKVTAFLQKKISENGGDVKRETLTLIKTMSDKDYFIDDENRLFRMYVFIDNATSYQIIENGKIFYESARSFAKFQNMLASFPADELNETIVNFHNTADRYRIFKEAIKENKSGRLSMVEKEVSFALDREKDASIIVDALKNNEIPLRVTHNDTKLNNVMIDDATNEGVCVIDLDTVMPGSLLYDFGDSIRFGASTAKEDEIDLDKVSMDISLFEEYVKGYFKELKGSITKKEAELLPMGAKLMTLECGVRFLTDFIDGDNYFKIHRENHNLDRARTQFKLVADMENKMDEMISIVNKYYN